MPGVTARDLGFTACQRAKISDNLPDLLSLEKRAGHGGSGNPVRDCAVKIGIRAAMEKLPGCQIRPQPALPARSMTCRAMRTEDLASRGLIGRSVEWIPGRNILAEGNRG